MYKVVSYETKCGLFGANIQKADAKMEEFINEYEKNGWELVSMTSLETSSKSFDYKMIFKKK